MKKMAAVLLFWVTGFIQLSAQTKTLSLREAVAMGVQNSKALRLAAHEIEQALAQAEQAKDASLPSVGISAGYNHALMLSQSFSLPAANGSDPQKLNLPFDNTLYQSTLSINQPIFAGNRFRYARQSANLLLQMSRLNAEADKDEVIFTVIQSYINYYKLRKNQKILAQNIEDIENKLAEIKKFEAQGLATKNDVLRFELERSNMKLTAIELNNNRKIVNYNLNVLLGLPDNTVIDEKDINYRLGENAPFKSYLDQGLEDRKDLSEFKYRLKLTDINIKKTQDEKLPTVSAGGNLYFINPSGNIVPKNGSYLAPFVVGINVGWDIGSLYKNKSKLTESKIRKQEEADKYEIARDRIKTEVNQSYLQYKQALEKVSVLQEAIAQAAENERIMESKFRNNLATTTERIDAQTLLYQARINLELSKSDATAAYYALLKSTGHIQL
ncbi:TolC family protein [Agriterribacter sp.]|uniref:TolC family protein n=1 Tax=Agriterribacter sp. TaxID=2821509 RepID=UPI002CE341F4|nr:TolC family protein [Agriterribacter sp.]HRP56024.1 TolC family protein [Agriterribacter sp.]